MARVFSLLLLTFFAFAQEEAPSSEPSTSNGSTLTGKIVFVNSQSNSVFIESQQYSTEFVTNFATKYTSGKNKIGYGDLATGQQVQYSFTQTGLIYELTSIDVIKPNLPEDTDITKPKTFTFTGTVQRIQPFNQFVNVLSSGTMRALVVSTACKFKKGKKGGSFNDLKVGAKVSVEAVRINGNRFDPMSITIIDSKN